MRAGWLKAAQGQGLGLSLRPAFAGVRGQIVAENIITQGLRPRARRFAKKGGQLAVVQHGKYWPARFLGPFRRINGHNPARGTGQRNSLASQITPACLPAVYRMPDACGPFFRQSDAPVRQIKGIGGRACLVMWPASSAAGLRTIPAAGRGDARPGAAPGYRRGQESPRFSAPFPLG